MNSYPEKKNQLGKGQGALEYLLLIGGAVLVATIVLITILSASYSSNTIISNNISTYQNQMNLATGGGGGPGWTCNNGTWESTLGEVCDGTDPTNTGCSGIQICNASCTACINPSVCPNSICEPGEDPTSCPADCSICGDGLVTALEVCDTSGNLNCSGATPICQTGCGACVAAPPTPPAFTFSVATGSGAGQLDLTWDVTSNYDGSAYNVVKAWIGSGPAITDPLSFQSAVGEDILYNLSASSGTSVPVFGTTSNVSYTVYMVACNGVTVATNVDCTLSSAQIVNSGYDAVLFETEGYTAQSGMRLLTLPSFAPPSTNNGIAINATTCVLPLVVGTADYTITPVPGSNPGTYKVWARVYQQAPIPAGNTTTATLGTAAFNIPITNPTAWVAASNTISLAGGSQALNLSMPCTTKGVYWDKFLITTDISCNPNTQTCT